MVVIKLLARTEAKRIRPTNSLDSVKRAEEWTTWVSKKVPFRYGEISARAGAPDRWLVSKAQGKNFYSYVLGLILGKDESKLKRIFSLLKEHLDEYEKIGAFHATTSKYLDKIVKEGILPPTKTGNQYEPMLTGEKRSVVHLFLPSPVTVPDPNAVSRYLRFEGGIPVIVGTSLGPENVEHVSLGEFTLEGDAITQQVPPEKITHVLVPIKHLEEFRRRYPDKCVLPLEPFFILLLLAKHGLNLWANRPVEGILKKALRNPIIRKEGNTIKAIKKFGRSTITYRFELPKKLKREHIDKLMDAADIEVIKEGESVAVQINGFPVVIIRDGTIKSFSRDNEEIVNEIERFLYEWKKRKAEGEPLEDMDVELAKHLARFLLSKIK